MRVLFTTAAWPSHFLFMVPLAWAFHANGHEVRIAAQPSVVPSVLRAGLPAVAVGPDLDFAALHRENVTEIPGEIRYKQHDGIVRIFHRTAELMVDDLVSFAEGWRPDLIIRDPVAFAASVAAEVVGAPLIRHAWGPDVQGTDQGKWLAASVLERLAPTYRRFGVTPPDSLGWTVVDPTPPSLRIPAEGRSLPMQYVPFNGAGVVPDWVLREPERPRVCVTWGTFTSIASDEQAMFRVPDVVRALADLDVEVIVAVTGAERALLHDAGQRVRVIDGLPIHALLPTCSAIVHHGGATTMLSAARDGVPQLLVAHMFEQRLNTNLLIATGAGYSVPSEDVSPRAIRDGVQALLTDRSYHGAAARVRDEILAQPTPTEVIGNIVQTLAGARPAAALMGI